MLGTRPRDLASHSRLNPKPLSSKVYLISDQCIELKNSVSLTTSSSYSSDEDQRSATKHKVSKFMKNAAPSVVTKYISMSKMDSPLFVEKESKAGGLYEKSIFSTALAIKTCKDVNYEPRQKTDARSRSATDSDSANQSIRKSNNVTKIMKAVNVVPGNIIATSSTDSTSYKTDSCSTAKSKRTIRRMKRNMMISSNNSIITDTSSLSANSSSTGPSVKSTTDKLTPLQRRVLKVRKFKEDKGSIGRAAGLYDDVSVENKSVKKNGDYETWKNKRSSKVDARDVKEEKSYIEQDLQRITPSASNGSDTVKTNETRSVKEQYELLAQLKASPPPPPYKLNEVPYNEETPFDECKDKVEMVILNNETFIIDKSRDVQHVVPDEDDAVAQRRMELVERARSLISKSESTKSVDRV